MHELNLKFEMRKSFKLIYFISSIFFLFGCNTNNKIDIQFNIKGFEKNGNNYSCKVNNDVNVFTLTDKVICDSSSAWKLYDDIEGKTEIPTKTFNLNIGDNNKYIYLTKNSTQSIYKVTVRRLNIFTVDFDTDGGSTINSQQIQEGSCIVSPDNPIKSGYHFVKWDKDIKLPIVDNTTFKAEYSSNSYKIFYNTDGGSSIEPTTVFYKTSFNLPTPVKNKYLFKGWYLNGNKVESGIYLYTNDITLLAHWELNEFTVNLYSNNQSGGTISGNGNYTKGSNVNIIANQNSNYDFAGWYLDSNYNSLVTNSNTYSFNIDKNEVFYAKFLLKYNITYELDGGTNNPSNPDTYNSDSNFTFANPTKEGYKFVKWVCDGKTITEIKKGSTGDIKLEAVWEIGVYKVTIIVQPTNADIGFSGDGNYCFNSSVTIKSIFKVSNWRFDRWECKLFKSYAETRTFNMPGEDLTIYLYAQYYY